MLAQSRLLEAARQAGKADLAREAEVRLDRLKRMLAEEKKPVIGPIKAEPYPGRSGSRHDRVVLLELFTGAECGPCVAADLAFDALSGAYRPTELITLEYHLHIPRPDPLTGPDSVARAAYYEVHSTPSTRFNGEPAALHGGPAEHARGKLNQYRSVIDEMLQDTRRATIELEATGRSSRSGSRPRPRFEARVRRTRRACRGSAWCWSKATSPTSGATGRRATTRSSARFPGALKECPLKEGKGQVETTVSLDKIREQQTDYLQAYPTSEGSRGKFPRALPPIALRHLSVVALVQDDADRRVLHAVVVPVEETSERHE